MCVHHGSLALLGAALSCTCASADLAFVNPSNGHQYTLLSEWMTWQDGRAQATALGSYLASITTQEEQDWVFTTIYQPYVQASELQMWLGATDELAEGTWLWDSGEAFIYNNWSLGNPNNRLDVSGPGQPGEDYASMWNHPAGTWNDYPGPLYYAPGFPPAPLLGWVLVETVIVPLPSAAMGGLLTMGLLFGCGCRRQRRSFRQDGIGRDPARRPSRTTEGMMPRAYCLHRARCSGQTYNGSMVTPRACLLLVGFRRPSLVFQGQRSLLSAILGRDGAGARRGGGR